LEANACREALASLISQEVSALTELAGLLDREHGLLVANDVTTLESVMAQRQDTVGRLLRAEEERRSLCRMHGRGVDAAGIENLMAWCDPQGSLKSQWADAANGAVRCRELNDRNGALVNARMKRVETLLGVLTGGSQEPQTYGPKGAYSTNRPGRVLATG
jgi:flagella synthesis protein FlgN